LLKRFKLFQQIAGYFCKAGVSKDRIIKALQITLRRFICAKIAVLKFS